MTKWILAAGAAALAITSPALSQHGGGHGGGKGGQQAAKAERGGGGSGRAAQANRGGGNRAVRADRGGGGNRVARADRGGGNRAAKADRGGGGNRVARADRGGGNRAVRADRGGGSNRVAKADRGSANRAVRIDRGGGSNRVAKADRGGGNREARSSQRFDSRIDNRGNARVRDRDAVRFGGNDLRGRAARFGDNDLRGRGIQIGGDEFRGRAIRFRDNDRFDRRFAGDIRTRDLIGGCPPGLARKFNGCLPPGQARNAFGNVWGLGAVLPATYYGSRYIPDYYHDYDRPFFSSLLLDSPDYYYRYGDGYVYRVNRYDNIVAGLIPLFGGGYSIGRPYPYGYGVYNVPYRYRAYYHDDDDCYYRYDYGAIYCVDRSSLLIASVVALLANDLVVGSPLPLGYDAYNVPYAYRARYYDTPDVWYRYNDGYVYGINPRTRIVQTVILV